MIDHFYLRVGQESYYRPRKKKYMAYRHVKRRSYDFGYAWSDMISNSRKRELVEIRFMVMKYLHDAGFSYTKIGRILQRDHATVIYGVRRCQELAEIDRRYAKEWRRFAKSYLAQSQA